MEKKIKKRFSYFDLLCEFPLVTLLGHIIIDRLIPYPKIENIALLIGITALSGLVSWFITKFLDRHVFENMSSEIYEQLGLRQWFNGKCVFSYNLFLILTTLPIPLYFILETKIA